MSLKAFHVIFITAAVLLAFGFGVWMLKVHKDSEAASDFNLGVGSLVVGAALVVYEVYFLRKLKKVSYL
jgi:hypothetical protein